MKSVIFSKRVKLVAAIFALGVVFLGALDQPPHYVCRATFEIDWEYTPTLSLDEKDPNKLQHEARKEVRDALTGAWPRSEQERLLEIAGRFPSSSLQAPEVTVVDQSERLTTITLEVASAAPEAAHAMASVALESARRLASNRLRMRGAEASFQSWSKVDDIKNRQDHLLRERALIHQNPPISYEGRARLNEINETLDQLEWSQAEDGLALLFNASKSLFGPELRVTQQPTVVEFSRADYWIGLVVIALFVGALAGGVANFLEKRRSKPASPALPPPLPTPMPPPLPPRIR
jgi:hypothetical protein